MLRRAACLPAGCRQQPPIRGRGGHARTEACFPIPARGCDDDIHTIQGRRRWKWLLASILPCQSQQHVKEQALCRSGFQEPIGRRSAEAAFLAVCASVFLSTGRLAHPHSTTHPCWVGVLLISVGFGTTPALLPPLPSRLVMVLATLRLATEQATGVQVEHLAGPLLLNDGRARHRLRQLGPCRCCCCSSRTAGDLPVGSSSMLASVRPSWALASPSSQLRHQLRRAVHRRRRRRR